MRTNWLVLDVSNMAWRAFLTTGGLGKQTNRKWEGTGMLYGFFQSLQHLCTQHNSRDLVFCFDHGESLRKKALKGYKQKRHARPLTDEQQVAIADMRRQVADLRRKWLPRLGYKNVFSANGYEGDDVIAQVVKVLANKANTDVIVVSSDKDLFQLLNWNVWMWDPVAKRMHSEQSFFDEYQVAPQNWPWVKAASGCATDEIPGIKGIGEKSALATFGPGCSERIAKLVADGQDVIARNLPLVTLPFAGCPKFRPVRCEVDLGQWRKMCDRLGFRTLRDRPPGGGGGFKLRHNPIQKAE